MAGPEEMVRKVPDTDQQTVTGSYRNAPNGHKGSSDSQGGASASSLITKQQTEQIWLQATSSPTVKAHKRHFSCSTSRELGASTARRANRLGVTTGSDSQVDEKRPKDSGLHRWWPKAQALILPLVQSTPSGYRRRPSRDVLPPSQVTRRRDLWKPRNTSTEPTRYSSRQIGRERTLDAQGPA